MYVPHVPDRPSTLILCGGGLTFSLGGKIRSGKYFGPTSRRRQNHRLDIAKTNSILGLFVCEYFEPSFVYYENAQWQELSKVAAMGIVRILAEDAI